MNVSYNICEQRAVWRGVHVISNEKKNQRKREFFSRTFWGPVPESRILSRIPKLSVEIDNFSADC